MTNTLRLIFPQWQGANAHHVANYVSELLPLEAMQGYVIGSQLLAWLAPPGSAVETVPVSMDASDAALHTEHGVFARQANLRQQQSALDILQGRQPARVLTLGGDCAVSLAPFSYLASCYPDDVALIWVDAHPDLAVPKENYLGLHAMALSALLGQGDAELLDLLPAHIAPDKALIVGLRDLDDRNMQRLARFGVAWQSPASANASSADVLAWLAQTGARKVLVHLDLDVLEPTELKAAFVSEPDGLTLAATSRIINDIARSYDLVGLTVAEPMPREVIKLRRLLHSLPLMQ